MQFCFWKCEEGIWNLTWNSIYLPATLAHVSLRIVGKCTLQKGYGRPRKLFKNLEKTLKPSKLNPQTTSFLQSSSSPDIEGVEHVVLQNDMQLFSYSCSV